MGGINGYLYTARHPEVVERLVIVDIGPDSITPAAAALWHDALRASAGAVYGEPEEAVAEWRAANPRAREPELRHFVRHNLRQSVDARWRWRFDAAQLGSFITGAPDAAEQWTALQAVTCPTLVIRGAGSEVLTASSAARMGRELVQGRVVEMPLAGHDLTVEQPHALSAHMRGFLDAV
jgi:pimeloyl-ACP methyl ester carboxylesterase